MQALCGTKMQHLRLDRLDPDTARIADLLHASLRLDKRSTVADFINNSAASSPLEFDRDQISELTAVGSRHLSYDGLQDNKAYQGMIWAFRALDKKDHHCHISAGISERDIAEIVCGADKETRKKMADALASHETEYNLSYPHLGKGVVTAEAVKSAIVNRNAKDIAFLLPLYRPFHLWRAKDFFVTDLNSFKQSVSRAALNLLADGITCFDLRVNPYKPAILSGSEREINKNTFDITAKVVETAVSGLDEAIDEAKGLGIPAKRSGIRLLFSMNRSKNYGSTPVTKITEEIFDSAALLNEMFPGRIAGLDISGAEYTINDHSALQWKDSVRLARKEGMSFTTHVGDLSSMRGELAGIYETAKTNPDKLEELIRAHMAFMRGFIELKPDSIGHAFMLEPSFLAFCWEKLNNDGYLFPELGSVPGAREGSEILKALIREYGIAIENCPSVTVSSEIPDDPDSDNLISGYSASPIFKWLKEGINVGLGTDGIFFGGAQPRTLSEEVVRLVLSRPDEITVEQTLKLIWI